WLSGREGVEYALPTEAQWEFACRAGEERVFSTFKQIENAYGNLAALKKVSPVGSKLPNAFGLYDMHDNLVEWCADPADRDYFRRAVSVNPKGQATGSPTERCHRGGSAGPGSLSRHPAWRIIQHESAPVDYQGFRVAIIGDLKPKSPPLAVAPF